MKKQIIMLIILILVSMLCASAPKQNESGLKPRYAADLIKIKLSADAILRANLPTAMYAESRTFSINELDQLLSLNGGTKVIRAHRVVKDTAWQTRTGFDRWFLIKLDGSTTVENAIKSFKTNRYIEEAIPEYYAYTTAVPNDTYYANNWGHNNTAQLPFYTGGSHSGAGVGTVGFDVDAQLAWDQSQGYGSASTIIAILDTGVDLTHPDLRLVTGYDYGDNDSNPNDDSAEPNHGTSCAGVAAARANNALGITGIAGGCSVMPLKIASADGSLGFTAIENALTHCGDNNVDVASMSFGAEGGMVEGDAPSTDVALEYAYSHGVTLLAATANSNTSAIAYPSNHNKVISVGAASPTGQRKSATSSDGETWWGSNYGTAVQDAPLAVDIMAPTILPATDRVGSVGYTTTDYFMWFNGTSCATPYAAGVAALLISKDPSLTPAQVRTAMVSTTTDMTFDGGAGWDRYTGYGMINANAALTSLVPGMPSCSITAPSGGAILDLNSTITVNVTAADTDGTITSVAFYVDDVFKNSDTSSPYTWSWNTTGYSSGAHTIKAIATDNSSNTAQSSVTITLLAPPDEGFETGDFSAFAWANGSAVPWTVQSSEKYSGTYAAKSGAIGDNASTTLAITMNVTSASNISFYQKVSSEANYDYLKFYIDSVEKGSWSGDGSWALQSYAVTTGTHTYTWTYSKDTNTIGGSDCAWIDHIAFPPHAVYYAPPQNLAAAPGNGIVNLSWAAPAGGTPTGYKIYKNSTYLTTVTGLSYTDNAVVNGTNYSYYLIAAYNGGDSEPTATVNATPNIISTAIIGSGTTVTGTTSACPINIYYKSLHGQSVYTVSELNAAGVYGPINITQLGFYIASVPTLALPNFVIRMKHTTEANVANWQTNTDMVTVYTNASYMPVAGGYQMLDLTTPFIWNGTSNLVVDTAFGLVATYSSTGTVQYSSVTNGYRYLRSDIVDETNIFSGGSTSTNRPNIKLGLAPVASNPQIAVAPPNLDFGDVAVGGAATLSFSITNIGGGTLSGNISTPAGYSVALHGREIRNTLAFSLIGLESKTYDLTFTPTSATSYSGNVQINSNSDTQGNYNLPVIGMGYIPATISLDTNQLQNSLIIGNEGSASFTISNIGSVPLTYSISTTEIRGQANPSNSRPSSGRSIAGSSFSIDVTQYTAGVSENWTFTVNNASADQEWLKDIYLTLPASVTVNSVTNFVGGTAQMIPDQTSGTGIIIHWNGTTSGGWGVIQGGETATATINVNVAGATVTPLELAYQLNGDVYGAEPHLLNGTITLNATAQPIAWFYANPMTGTINPGSSDTITGHFSAVGMAAGSYGAVLTVHSNDPAHPIVDVGVQMDVLEPNHAPNISLPDIFEVDLYSGLTVDFSAFVSDIDGDSLMLSCTGNEFVQVQIVGLTVTFSALFPLPFPGVEILTFTVNDGVASASDAVNVIVIDNPTLNTPPEIQLPPMLDFPMNGSLVVDFSGFVFDIDGDPLTLSCSGNTNVLVTINGLNVTFNATADWFGMENISFTVSDGISEASANVLVSVLEDVTVNNPPTILPPPPLEFPFNGFLTYDFSSYVYDADGDPITISYSGNTNILVSIDGFMLTFTAIDGWFGSEDITITVSDGFAESSIVVPVSVNYTPPVNTPPTIDLPESVFFDMNTSLVLDFGLYVYDAEGDPLTLSYTGNTNVIVSVDGLSVTFSAAPNWFGNETIAFTVSDGIAEASDSLMVIVIDVPDINIPPSINLPDSFSFDMNTSLVLDLGPYVQDGDGDPLTLSYTGNTDVLVSINGMVVTLTATPDWYGSEQITFIVSDGIDEASDFVDVVVNFVVTYLDTPQVQISESDGSITVEWGMVPFADSYQVFRSIDPMATYELVATTSELQWVDTAPQDRAFYYVKAIFSGNAK